MKHIIKYESRKYSKKKNVRKAWWRWTASWASWEWCWMFVLFVFLVDFQMLFCFSCLVILLSLFHAQIKQKWMKWMRYSGKSIKKQHHIYINMKFARIFRVFGLFRWFLLWMSKTEISWKVMDWGICGMNLFELCEAYEIFIFI